LCACYNYDEQREADGLQVGAGQDWRREKIEESRNFSNTEMCHAKLCDRRKVF
jgi:hypothetical protein